MTTRTRDALARLEAADPADGVAFAPPALTLPLVPRAPSRRRAGRRLALAAAVAAVAAVVAVLVPRGGDGVLARAAAAVGGADIVFTEARQVEFGRVVARELSWTSGDGTRSRVLHYDRRGRLESEIVSRPGRVEVLHVATGTVDVLDGAVAAGQALSGDPVTLLARARRGDGGLQVAGEGRIAGERVHFIEAPSAFGRHRIRIAVSDRTFLPVSATMGLTTYEYERVEKLPFRARLLAPRRRP